MVWQVSLNRMAAPATDDWLKRLETQVKSPAAALAAYVDKSVANLSSIVVLAECGHAKILLTGDACGDKILEGLKLAGLLDPDKGIHVDIIKVPHHGSANNLEQDFFERIAADHYVFSGDGEHGNPEREVMQMVFDARGAAPFTAHLTYSVEEIDIEREAEWQLQQEKQRKKNEPRKHNNKAPLPVRGDWSREENSLAAFIESRALADGKEIKIVDEGKHVIDLLDPLGY